jgi:hypothetical protein
MESTIIPKEENEEDATNHPSVCELKIFDGNKENLCPGGDDCTEHGMPHIHWNCSTCFRFFVTDGTFIPHSQLCFWCGHNQDQETIIKKTKIEKCEELNDLLNINSNIRSLLKEANKFKDSDNETIKSMIPIFEEMKTISDKQKENLNDHGIMRIPITNERVISSEEINEMLKENKNITVKEAFKKKFGPDFKVENPIYFIPIDK